MQPDSEPGRPALQPTYADGDQLLAWQLQVARRADELARTKAAGTAFALHCWLLAEIEVMGKAWPRESAELCRIRP